MRSKTNRYIIYLSLSVLFLISCDGVIENEYETQFNVYTVMNNYLPYTEVVVDRAFRIDEPSEPYVDDAIVLISSFSTVDTLAFDEIFEVYLKWHVSIQAGTTYHLEVIRQGLDTLFGTTTVPEEFQFINMPGDTITLEDTVVFTRNNGAAVYYCLFISGHTDEFWLKPDTLDSLVKIRVGDYIGNFSEGLCNIRITAFDRNFYKYTFEPDDSLWQAGVTNGLGLCGSAWQEQIILYLDISD